MEAGWAPGPVWTDGKSRPHRVSIPDRPARSQLGAYSTNVNFYGTPFTVIKGLYNYYLLLNVLQNGYRVFPGGKVRPGRAADHSPPSSAAVMEE